MNRGGREWDKEWTVSARHQYEQKCSRVFFGRELGRRGLWWGGLREYWFCVRSNANIACVTVTSFCLVVLYLTAHSAADFSPSLIRSLSDWKHCSEKEARNGREWLTLAHSVTSRAGFPLLLFLYHSQRSLSLLSHWEQCCRSPITVNMVFTLQHSFSTFQRRREQTRIQQSHSWMRWYCR